MIHCPFCKAEEDERLMGTDRDGKTVVLLMFNCPFFFRVAPDIFDTDEKIQNYMNGWRKREGDAWLDSVGPILKRRELRNIERSMSLTAN
jgi:hypothetical protein